MKNLKIVLIALMIFGIAMPTFAKKAKVKVAKVNRPEVIEYQGSTIGKDIPNWVTVLVEGDNAKLEKSLGLKGDKVWVVEAKGPNLQFLKTWTDLVNIETEVAGQIERTVAQSIQSTMLGSQSTDAIEIESTIEMYAASLKNVTLNGLEKNASFWVKTQTLKPGLKKSKSASDYIIEYTYYVVYTMKQDLYENQIIAAIEDVETNTDQAQLLRENLTARLRETVTVGSSTTIKE